MLLLLAFSVFSFVLSSPKSVDVGDVTIEFTGASGGFKMTKNNTDGFLKVESSSLVEIDSEGKRVASYNPAGGEFGDITRAGKATTTTYTNDKQNRSFLLKAWMSPEATEVEDDFANRQVNLTAEAVKFSIKIEGWEMASDDNKLQYSIIVKDRTTGDETNETTAAPETTTAAPETTAADEPIDEPAAEPLKETTPEITTRGDGTKVFEFPDGTIEVPLLAQDDEGDVNVEVTVSQKGGKTVITFTFDSFTGTLVYDPDVSLNEFNEPAEASAAAVNFISLGFSLLAVFLM